MKHERAVEALTRALASADSDDVRDVYLAAVKGIPDGNLPLAVDQAIRELYQPHVLSEWKRG